MKSHLSLSRLLGSKDIYPNEALSTKRHYAERIGSKRLRQFAALYLSPVKQKEDIALEELIAQWFTFNGNHTYQQSPSFTYIYDHLRRIRNFHAGEHLHLINSEALLNLLVWLENNPDLPEEVAEDAGVTIHLFHLNLLFNDDVLAFYQQGAEITRLVQDDNYLQRVTLSLSFSQADLFNIDYSQLFYTQFYKAIRLLDFLEATPKYQPLFQAFLAEFGVSKKDYFKLLGLAIVAGSKGQDGWNVIQVPKDDLYAENCAFLDKVAITPDYDVLDEQNDYLSLRSRPIKRIDDGEYISLFPLFLIKKLFNGTIFLLSDLQQRRPELLSGSFLGHIRADFSEEVLLYDVLDQLYPKTATVRLTGKVLKAAGMIREPDYYLRVGNTVVLHESKDFFIPGETKLSYNIDEIEKLLKTDGRGSVPPKPDRLGKAVVQVAANIERVLKMQIAGDTDYDPAVVEIFPVIVVYDSLYSAAGLNFRVHYWMEDEINKLKAKPEFEGVDFSRVHPVTLVEIDTLINYESYFANGTLDYIGLLRAYQQTMNYQKVNITDIVQFAEQSCMSFSKFIGDVCMERNLPLDLSRLNALLISYGIV
ncbi:hypothetical protein SIO70_14630 [Chitinophaga sancti]|uniref:hypothetical protein n=1 Tax=Chitinophaga sancti TaxID=1004 RepID=UPI002A75F343|nr:hypothetical protein [Chitinophaga sancti]WPQ66095.1 hypothetical protein SIO70_14630 [Chitinophaga sancti]